MKNVAEKNTARPMVPIDNGKIARKYSRYVWVAALAVVFGILLEAGRLFGARFVNMFDLAEWNLVSVLIYACLSFAIGWSAVRFGWYGRLKKALEVAKIFVSYHGKFFVLCLLGSLVLSVVICSLITVVNGFSEPLPLALFLSSFLFAVSLSIVFRLYAAEKMEWFFLACILTFGMGFITLSPIAPFYSWDDEIHYAKSLSLSYLDNPVYTASDSFVVEPTGESYMGVGGQQYTVAGLLDSWDEMDRRNGIELNRETQLSSALVSYSSLGYIPSAVGLYFGRLFHLPYAQIFDFGRFANLLFFSVMTFMGMRKLKSKKTIACAVMLLPTTVFLACNYSYDPWLISLLFYAVASVVGLLQSQDQIDKSAAVKIISAFVLGLGPKAIYFPLLMLLFLIPKARFSSKKSLRAFRISVVLVLLMVMASFIVPMFIGGASSDLRGGSEVNAMEQIRSILANPLGYCGILASFGVSYLSPLLASGYTTDIAYLGAIGRIAPLFYGWLLVCAFFDNGLEENRSFAKPRYKFACVGVCILVLIGIFSALYITYTPVGSLSIAGVQGRYLIPLLFPFLGLCLNFNIPRVMSRQTAGFMAFLISALGLYLVFFIQFLPMWIG